tara:strand:+ start:1533 stop:1727 length:195 start_codon:yes stop_codon:yes gene_type:complete
MSNFAAWGLIDANDSKQSGILRASSDWQKVGSNENPFSPVSHPLAHKAYDDKFEDLIEMQRGFL